MYITYSATNSIDGSCLELIDERELEDDLHIQHKIVRKKLMNCNYGIFISRDQDWIEGIQCSCEIIGLPDD
jgi:hypothetical protein